MWWNCSPSGLPGVFAAQALPRRSANSYSSPPRSCHRGQGRRIRDVSKRREAALYEESFSQSELELVIQRPRRLKPDVVGRMLSVSIAGGRGWAMDVELRLELDGDALEPSQASAADQERLIELFVSRHATGEVGPWPASGKP